ncbi:hypothetical protein K505DRAFT_320103 [Melanomma pulvis-pyrius CBS 109.77]|uniref:Uncharacterized protein n=1 Tax=Melanomma pulvis-pyrius CBS 109.77 TaxID=1314802 RepID=A0A6A6XX37_9PLEO|nr:hypothetical protein K505DRAFT_320103 [Melanomma pulvis-pyrius CBS 109.77]
MHCIWAENIVFFKPIPRYLGSFAFWEYVLDSSPHCISGSGSDDREKLLATALGFLGTYARLIQRRSDFNIALRHGLLASFTRKDGYEDGRIAAQLSFEDFSLFIASFDALPSCTISTRWRFGELVLGPLNFHSVLYLRRWHLNRYEGRYAAYFQRFFPVVLFMFALFSVALSAMQVILGAKQLWETENKELKRTLGVFIWFATEAIAWSVAFGAVFVVWWIGISGSEAWKRHRLQKRMRKKVEGSGMP